MPTSLLAISCLALNLYHEAAFEPLECQFAVAFVTKTRSEQRKLDICSTVFEPKQFSWTNNALDKNGKLLPQYFPIKGERWNDLKMIAKLVLNNDVNDLTKGATHYYASYISPPKWDFNKLEFKTECGQHLFYKEE